MVAVSWGGPRALSDGPQPFSQLSGAALTGRPWPGGQGLCRPRGPRRPTCPVGREAVRLGKARAVEWVPLEWSGCPGRPLEAPVSQNTKKCQYQLQKIGAI